MSRQEAPLRAAGRRHTIGIVGLGGMGSKYLTTFAASDRWSVVWACDLDREKLDWAQAHAPVVKTTADAAEIISDPAVDVVGVFTLADIRPRFIEQALDHDKHVMAEILEHRGDRRLKSDRTKR